MSGEAVAIEDRGYRYLVYPDGKIKYYDITINEYVLMERYIRTNGQVAVRAKCGDQNLWLDEKVTVAKAFLGETPRYRVVTHKDKNRGNNSVDNLFFTTKGKSKRRRGFICELV